MKKCITYARDEFGHVTCTHTNRDGGSEPCFLAAFGLVRRGKERDQKRIQGMEKFDSPLIVPTIGQSYHGYIITFHA